MPDHRPLPDGASRPAAAIARSREQLALRLALPHGPSLLNFEPGPNGEALSAVTRVVGGEADGERVPRLLLWGTPGTGKTHLLQAGCRAAAAHGRTAAYLPLGEIRPLGLDALEGLEHCALVAFDDLDDVAGDAAWEEGVFHLFNRAEAAGAAMLFAAKGPPGALGLGLADLVSRLATALVLPLRPLSDPQRLRALRQRAAGRGFELPEPVAAYLLRREPRSLHALMALLERLDRESLAAKRRITIPFVKALLDT